jgi:hypothetical protein
MKAQRLSRFVAVVGIVLAVLVGGLSGGLSGAADPHFSNVTGILGGTAPAAAH